jgi:hypothetical protein
VGWLVRVAAPPFPGAQPVGQPVQVQSEGPAGTARVMS